MAVAVTKPNSPVLLGRELTFWTGIANSVLALLLGMKWLDTSPENTAILLTAVNAVFAVVAAIMTRPFPVPLLSAALVAVLTCAAGFGLDITSDQISLWNGLLVAVWSAYTRSQVSPEPGLDPAPVIKGEVVR